MLLITPRIMSTPPPRRTREMIIPLSTTAGLYECIVMSGIIDYSLNDQFSRELNTSLSSIPNIIQDLAMYPPKRGITYGSYQYIRRQSRDVFNAVLNILGLPNIPLYTSEEKIFIITRGFIPPNIEVSIRTRQERFNDLKLLTRTQLILLARLYDVEDGNDIISDIASHPPRLIEAYIRAIGKYTYQQLADALGMVVPSGMSIETYFLDNITHYSNALERPPTIQAFTPSIVRNRVLPLNLYTDKELILYFNAHINYQSRLELLTNLRRALTEPMFFIVSDPKTRSCINTQSAFLNSVKDPDIWVISFGTLFDYVCYEPLELDYAFGYANKEQSTESFMFRHPENVKVNFTLEQVTQLRDLLLGYKDKYPEVNNIINTINQGLTLQQAYNTRDVELVSTFNRIKVDDIRNYLINLFYVGMYMRRWEGPGCPYPIRAGRTYKMVPPDQRTSEGLVILSDIYDKMKKEGQTLIDGLTLVEYDEKGQIIRSDETVKSILTRVANSEYCIRIASSRLIWTGVYYLQLLYHEGISGFNPATLERIL